MSREAINHPAHYGGADNPYEAIKVMEAWLTPEEFVGALKFSFFTYQARARRKNGLEDHEKAAWYQARLIEFIRRTGYREAEPAMPAPLYWTEDQPEPTTDYMDLLISAPMWEPIPIHSDHAPHVRWLVRIPIVDAGGDPEGEEIETFASHADALAYCDSAKADEAEAIDRQTGRLDAAARGHSALYAAADLVIEDGIVTKTKSADLRDRPAPDYLFEQADLIIEQGAIVKAVPGLYQGHGAAETPIVPRHEPDPRGLGEVMTSVRVDVHNDAFTFRRPLFPQGTGG